MTVGTKTVKSVISLSDNIVQIPVSLPDDINVYLPNTNGDEAEIYVTDKDLTIPGVGLFDRSFGDEIAAGATEVLGAFGLPVDCSGIVQYKLIGSQKSNAANGTHIQTGQFGFYNTSSSQLVILDAQVDINNKRGTISTNTLNIRNDTNSFAFEIDNVSSRTKYTVEFTVTVHF